MNQEIRELEPKALWNKFADLNAVPRPSKKEERVIAFMKKFGEDLGLETFVDTVGNVIVRKPATTGMEDRKAVVLQSHLDMVHQKNADTIFDFDSQGIEMYVDGDWVRAKGTTLGADNGLGVATIMAVLESKTIEHPALEALFTIDEETGMTGAIGLKGGLLNGDILLNLDTEEDDEIGVGCAGGIDVTATKKYSEENTPDGTIGFSIEIKGLNGGHSGMDIIKGLGNANVFMNRLLFKGYEKYGLRVSSINGGSLRNAIPRESFALVVVDKINVDAFKRELIIEVNHIKAEYATLESDLDIVLSETPLPEKVMELSAQEAVIKSVYASLNGVHRMSPDIEGLVETSNNIAKIIIADGHATVMCLTRSSVDSNKDDLSNKLTACFELGGFDVELSGSYPGWTPNMNSSIVKSTAAIYKRINGEEANVAACHAGLECGILGTHYPDMEMVSFGPTIKGAHSPDERASISSAKKYWHFFLEVLKETPMK
jgi:dipeptidase D